MAGVGFMLRRLVKPRTFTGYGAAFAYASALSTGPWVMTVATLVMLFFSLKPALGLPSFELFSTGVMVAFAGSLIVSGPWMTRTA